MSGGREGIYRRISVRMWGDAKFRRLSRMPPSGQSLWVYLLTGEHTISVPGVFVAGRAAMAEALEWSQEDFGRAAAELLDQGMAIHDAKTRLWFLPNGIRHNFPASPNVVRSWRGALATLPECELRERIVNELRRALTAEGEAWVRALDEALGLAPSSPSPNPSGKTSPKPLPKASPIQEQEQEQDSPLRYAQGERHAGASELREFHASGTPAPEGASSTSQAQSTPTSGKAKGSRLPPCPQGRIVDAYHDKLPDLPAVRIIDAARESAMRRVWIWVFTSGRATTEAEALDWFGRFFDAVRESDFLMGRTPRGKGHESWRCNFDYLLSNRGLKHVVEGLS